MARAALRTDLAWVLGLARRPSRRAAPADAWIAALCAPNPCLELASGELAAFQEQYRIWMQAAGDGTAEETFRVCFRLEPPEAGPDWTVQYLLQAADDPSLLVPAAEIWRQRGATARFLNRRFDQPQERLLAGLGRAARLFVPFERSLSEPAPRGCRLTVDEAYQFLREAALLLQANGFGVLVPAIESKVGIRIRLGRKASAPGQAGGPAAFGWESLVQEDWQGALGDQTLTPEEFAALARLKQPLVQVRGQWIELQPEQVEQALALFRQQEGGGEMSLQDALKLVLSPDEAQGLPVLEVSAEGWIDELLAQPRDGGTREPAQEPPGFAGQLRGEQKVGLAWLAALRRYGLGACLADDMGLGKTPQLIALLLHQRATGGVRAPAPLVCPTSVVGNWRRELARFAPELRVLVHHGAGRARQEFAALAREYDVVISTYALLHRDEAELSRVPWSALVLDEAQNIKNAATKAAQTARTLPADWRGAHRHPGRESPGRPVEHLPVPHSRLSRLGRGVPPPLRPADRAGARRRGD